MVTRTERRAPVSMRRLLGAAAVAAGLSLPAAAQADGIEPEADRVLNAMAGYLTGVKALTADYEVDSEIILGSGQKIQYSASGSIALERPDKLHLTRKGAFADGELTFDGKTVSVYGAKANAYGQFESPGPSIDEAAEELRATSGLDLPGADLLSPNVYDLLVGDVVEGVEVGPGFVGGVECDHLAFRNPQVDWQIWVSKGDKPLPMKYIVTTKWVTGAPQYTIRFSNWNTAPQLDAKLFTFTPPEGARKLAELIADEIGEIAHGAEQ